MRAVQVAQAGPLPATRVEVLRRQPALERRLARRPLAIEHREESGVAVAALRDHVLAQHAFEGESIAQRRPPRRRVERVALPFITAIAEFLEGVTREEILRFGPE